MDDLLQEFIAETRETLEGISGEIVAWEANPADRGRLDSIFRFVHTVKGSCGFLDLPRLERLSHAAEDVLAAVRSGKRDPDKALVDAVLAIIDRIGEIVEAIDAGASFPDSGEDMLVAALDAEVVAPARVSAEAPIAPAIVPRAPTPTRSVRLSVDLLDRMMSGMSDMVLARNDLARRMREDADPTLEAALERLSSTVADMRDTVTRTRMQKIEALFTPLPRMVRDTAAAVGKQVMLSVEGSDVELDREMIEMMRDPLVHMVRNAIDHGIETPDERRAAGKRATGRLTISARQSGNRIIIEIADDGRGIDADRLVAKKIAQEPTREAALRNLTARGKLDLVFEPGLSSRDQVTALSGRGVGMDVVRANVEQIGGRIELASAPGQGLVVTIEVPLTLAILSAVVVSVGDQRFAVPRQAIEEIVATRGDAIRVDALGGSAITTVRDRRLALVDLGAILALPDRTTPPMLVLVDVPGGAYALGVDAVFDTAELVVKPAAPAVMSAGVYAGQTLPDTGVPMLLLDCAGIAAMAGLVFERETEEEDVALVVVDAGIPAMLFEDLDGHRRMIALGAIDRVEYVAVEAVSVTAGRLRIVAGDRMIPLVATGALPASGQFQVMRLHDRNEVGYAIASAIDIVRIDAPISPAASAGPISGVTVIQGEPVEIIDPLWVLDQADRNTAERRPTLLLQGGETGWMATFLTPALEAAGYTVVASLAPDGRADIALAMEHDCVPTDGGAPVLRLSRDRGAGVYCYDRAALVAAIAERLAEAG